MRRLARGNYYAVINESAAGCLNARKLISLSIGVFLSTRKKRNDHKKITARRFSVRDESGKQAVNLDNNINNNKNNEIRNLSDINTGIDSRHLSLIYVYKYTGCSKYIYIFYI